MKDLIENYTVVSNDCTGYSVYAEFYPKTHPAFIQYTTPLIATRVYDFEYIKLCERYDYYMTLMPEIVPTIYNPIRGEKDIVLGDVRIQIAHGNEWPFCSDSPSQSAKWESRAKVSMSKTKIFIWDASNFMTLHTEEERRELLDRFKRLDSYSFFVTEREDEEFEDEMHVVKFLPLWKGLLQTSRYPHDGYVDWPRLGKMGNIHTKQTCATVSVFLELFERKLK